MKKVTTPKRVGIAEAKAHLSDVVRSAEDEPVIIHNRGRDVAVVVGVATYERLRAAEASAPTGMAHFMAEVAELREKYGGGADLEYRRIEDMPPATFGRRRK